VPSDKRARQRAAREARLAAQEKLKRRRQLVRNGLILAGVVAVILIIVFALSTGKHNNKPTSTSPTTTTTTTLAHTAAQETAQRQANAVAVKAGCPSNPYTRVNTQTYKSAPAMTIDTGDLYSATVKTTDGSFIVALDAKSAPVTTNNFVFLARKGYFHCVIFHRVIPGEFSQTGDPTGTGKGGPGYTIADELPATAPTGTPQYPAGSVAMANTGAANTGGSQWFVVVGGTYENLSPTYSLFGRIVSGMPVVTAITAEGNAVPADNGVPPDVVQRILSVKINQAGS
jgi:peptidyl-prolyl cis-trans isomerase B (cyclophilin B)